MLRYKILPQAQRNDLSVVATAQYWMAEMRRRAGQNGKNRIYP